LKKTPKNLHVYKLFIKPKELEQYCKSSQMHVKTWVGLRPNFFSMAFFKSVLSARVLEGFEFQFTSSLAISYMGLAEK
jgi:2-polyprenyl-6-hydroxyphenyl methylase/3-demethylubiquinone-9 3-methyltransferase